MIRDIYEIYQSDYKVNELNKHIINFDSAYKSKYLYEAIAVLEAFLKRPKIISPYKPYVKAREIHKITPPININIENKNYNTNNQTINLLEKK